MSDRVAHDSVGSPPETAGPAKAPRVRQPQRVAHDSAQLSRGERLRGSTLQCRSIHFGPTNSGSTRECRLFWVTADRVAHDSASSPPRDSRVTKTEADQRHFQAVAQIPPDLIPAGGRRTRKIGRVQK